MNKTEKEVLENVIMRLRGANSTEDVSAALTGPCRLYLETWVISPLELILREDRTREQLELARGLSKVPRMARERYLAGAGA